MMGLSSSTSPAAGATTQETSRLNHRNTVYKGSAGSSAISIRHTITSYSSREIGIKALRNER